MAKINLEKHIWEGWTVGAFIQDLEPMFDVIMCGQSWKKPFTTKQEVKKWCMNMQSGYKNYIPDVVKYFVEKAKIK